MEARMRVALLLMGLILTVTATRASSALDASQFDLQTQRSPSLKPIALVYKGPGSCDGGEANGCSEAAARIAKLAGFGVVYITPEGLAEQGDTESAWLRARVWLQPGGRARTQVLAMTSPLKNRIREFVRAGGGYVGFCAGGFLATEKFGWVDSEKPENSFESEALGLLPGYSQYFDQYESRISEDHTGLVIDTQWNGSPRQVYWELGPYFDQTTLQRSVRSSVEVISRYPEGQAMTVRSSFGLGRVFVTAVHPEAPQTWYDYYKLVDRDGLDASLAVAMVKWVTTP